jgi:uncharacterized protein YndB with AHSA1/START domain
MAKSVSVSRVIKASPDAIYPLVSALERMGEWSPEARGGTWSGTPGAVGSRFKGANANEGKAWSTSAVVTDAVPGKRFAFSVDKPVKVALWAYDLEAVDGGTKVTESWVDQRNWFIAKLGPMTSKVTDRTAHNRRGMEITLERLAAALEAE